MRKLILRLVVLSAPLSLAACGEGWVAQKTTTAFPYGNQRTAGPGVAYVRAQLLPEKELKIEPIAEEKAEVSVEPIVEVETALDANEIFTEAQVKGGAAPIPAPKKAEAPKIEEAEEEIVETIEKSNAEKYIAQEPKQIEAAEVAEIAPEAGSSTMNDLDMAFGAGFEAGETIEIYENEVSQPLKQIIVPKQDFMDLRTQGEKSLDEIYNDNFINSF